MVNGVTSGAYEAARDKLVHEAAEAVEIYGDDELERYAAEVEKLAAKEKRLRTWISSDELVAFCLGVLR
jgi:hypothetical protein